jgi:Cu/Ag efflux protein CusF
VGLSNSVTRRSRKHRRTFASFSAALVKSAGLPRFCRSPFFEQADARLFRGDARYLSTSNKNEVQLMKRMQRLIAVCVTTLVFAAICLGQAPGDKKSFMFHGKVVSVDEKAGSLNVDGENTPGWMEAMTMDYKVDDPAVLKKVKPGDRIMATVYSGDYSLHKVMVMPKTDSKTKK